MKDEVTASSSFVLYPSSVVLTSTVAPGAPLPATTPASTAAAAPEILKDKAGVVLPSVDKLGQMKGDAKRGREIYHSDAVACFRCHQVADKGGEVGPPLTTIGEKLSKAQLHEAILYPSAGILMGYENWRIKTKDGDIYDGLLASETDETVSLKDTAGKYHDIPVANIEKKTVQKISIMPDGMNLAMTTQELVDLVEYLTTLRNP